MIDQTGKFRCLSQTINLANGKCSSKTSLVNIPMKFTMLWSLCFSNYFRLR